MSLNNSPSDQFFKILFTNTSADNFITCKASFLKIIPKYYLGKTGVFVITNSTESKSRLYSWVDRNKLSLFKIRIFNYDNVITNIIKYRNWYNIVIIDNRDLKYLIFINNILKLNGLINKNIRFVFSSSITNSLPLALRNNHSLLYGNWRYIDIQLKKTPLPHSLKSKPGKLIRRFDSIEEEESDEQVF